MKGRGRRFLDQKILATRAFRIKDGLLCFGLDFAAFESGAGLGTIIEGNQLANVWYGIFASTDGAKDT
jgi:hypothetical protein